MRVFLAIDFPEEIKQTLLQKIDNFRQSYPEFKWIKKPALHLTIKFIGEVQESTIPEIHNLLKEDLQNINPFTLSTTELGFFPNPTKARVFYLDLEKSGPLHSCFSLINEKLATIGIEKETRAFHPHITLARIKNRALSYAESNQLLCQQIPKLEINVKEIVLMQSELLPGGARYTAVQRFSLHTI